MEEERRGHRSSATPDENSTITPGRQETSYEVIQADTHTLSEWIIWTFISSLPFLIGIYINLTDSYSLGFRVLIQELPGFLILSVSIFILPVLFQAVFGYLPIATLRRSI